MTFFEGYAVKCGRCGVVTTTRDCPKLEHFGIYRVVCPHCGWPGRYVASELHPVTRSEHQPAIDPDEQIDKRVA